MRKSLALQQELGPVFDITFDGEDGAAHGNEKAMHTCWAHSWPAQKISSPASVHAYTM